MLLSTSSLVTFSNSKVISTGIENFKLNSFASFPIVSGSLTSFDPSRNTLVCLCKIFPPNFDTRYSLNSLMILSGISLY